MEPLLRVRDLYVDYKLPHSGLLPAVRGVDFDIAPGESVGVLGESGCGKSTLAAAIPRLLPVSDVILRGSVIFRGRELTALADHELRSLRGAEIEFIHQEPALALNPVLRVERQVADVARAHGCGGAAGHGARAVLEQVGLPIPRASHAYPHQLSGGQRQRVVIAQALVCRPALVIADEPTSSLDSTTQAEILGLLGRLRSQTRIALLLISHDPAVLGALCDRVLVMYAGQIVEQGPLREVYCRPLHPYTKALLSLLDGEARRRALPCITGIPPDPMQLPPGCAFEPRCPESKALCQSREPQQIQQGGRRVRCFNYGG